jgi:hypothetical protein
MSGQDGCQGKGRLGRFASIFLGARGPGRKLDETTRERERWSSRIDVGICNNELYHYRSSEEHLYRHPTLLIGNLSRITLLCVITQCDVHSSDGASVRPTLIESYGEIPQQQFVCDCHPFADGFRDSRLLLRHGQNSHPRYVRKPCPSQLRIAYCMLLPQQGCSSSTRSNF